VLKTLAEKIGNDAAEGIRIVVEVHPVKVSGLDTRPRSRLSRQIIDCLYSSPWRLARNLLDDLRHRNLFEVQS
jgi:hypothetical protein